MFSKTAADGSTSYAPGQGTSRQASPSQGTPRHASSCQGTPLHHIFSDDEEEAAEEAAAAEEEDAAYDEEDVHTPVSIGSKRSSSSRSVGSLRSTADSPSKKKCRSPAIRAMISGIERLTNKLDHTQSYMEEKLEKRAKQREEAKKAALKKQQEEAKQAAEEEQRKKDELKDEMIKLARECGATETDEAWLGLYNMLQNPSAIQFFLSYQTAEGRLKFLRHQATMRPPV
jgi:hypothetical protein